MRNSPNNDAPDVEIGREQIFDMAGNFFVLTSKSTLLGISFGLLSALIMKHFQMNHDPIKECSIVLMMAFLSYHCAEQVSLSGIITIFTCGLFMAHYTFYNMGKLAQKGTTVSANTLANLSQCFLYVYLGLSSFPIEAQDVKMDMIYCTLAAVAICRIFSIGIPLLIIYLWSGCKPLSLKWNQWLFCYVGGLIRGAIAFGLAL